MAKKGKFAHKGKLLKAVEIRLDIGCGTNKRPGHIGIDVLKFDGVDVVMDVRKTPWPYKDDSVDGIFTSHFIEHLTGPERIEFFNECYRVMKPGAKIQIIVPDWTHDRAYGDPTHQWPPMSRWSFLYINREWREKNAPHVGYKCHFSGPINGSMEPWVQLRNTEAQMFLTQHNTNALLDLMCELEKVA